ncbi:hypothetical protein ACFWIB_11715 [Streptomyces sp. NPDC127051]|uniref:hypothetical protein n=1 Tax=Streptomyces sp. NPDC127051 TaxID=3347119 RepID=UPI00364BD87B
MSSTNAKTLAARAASAPTELHKNFAAWLKAETGVDVDLKTVQLACSMRMDFQASEANQADLAKRKKAAADKKQKAAAEKRARLEKQLAALQAELAKETETPATPVAKKAATPTPAEPVTPAVPQRAPSVKRPTSARPAAK